MSKLVIEIEITNVKNEKGEVVKEYTPSVTYHDGKKETSLPEFDSINLKWANGGRGKGLSSEVKLRTPVLRKGRLEMANKTFEIPRQLEEVIQLAQFTKNLPVDTEETKEEVSKETKTKGKVKGTKPAIKVEDPDLNESEVEDVAEAVV